MTSKMNLTKLAAITIAMSTALMAQTTKTSNLSVTASVANNCTISTTSVAFGAYDPIVANASSNNDNTGKVTVTCTSGASTTITLGQGSNAGSGSTDAAPARRLTDGATTASYLTYALYSESGRSTVWGNTSGTGVAHTGTGTATDLTVYGRITSGQNVPAGSYTDTVVATVTF